VRALLRVVQSPEERFAAGQGPERLQSTDYGIGRTKGAGLVFDDGDKARIREILQAAEGIDPTPTRRPGTRSPGPRLCAWGRTRKFAPPR
jgi:hypothetical protein